MEVLSRSAFSTTRRIQALHVRAGPLLHRQGPRFRPNQWSTKLPARPASQWNRRRPSRPSYSSTSFSILQAIWRSSLAFRLGFGGLAAYGTVFFFYNIETVPVSGRRRFNWISPKREAFLAEDAFKQTLQQYRDRILPPNHPQHQLVLKVLRRLLPVSGVQDQNWEVRVIDQPRITNAFVMPGGKIFVFTGILPICESEDGLAQVLGHEIGHNVAHHHAENMSKAAPLQILTLAISLITDFNAGLTSSFIDLILKKPNSRTQESEADRIGLLMAAKACYDPQAAVGMWTRMAKLEKAEGYSTPQFLSTHPTSLRRIDQLKEWIPEARKVQSESECGMTSSHASQFRNTIRQPQVNQAKHAKTDGDDDWF